MARPNNARKLLGFFFEHMIEVRKVPAQAFLLLQQLTAKYSSFNVIGISLEKFVEQFSPST